MPCPLSTDGAPTPASRRPGRQPPRPQGWPGEVVVGLQEGLVEDGGQQGLAGGEVAVDGAAGYAGGLGDRAHGGVLVAGQELGGCVGDGGCGGVVRSCHGVLDLSVIVMVL